MLEPGSVTGLHVFHSTHCAPEDSGTGASSPHQGLHAGGLSVVGQPRGGRGRCLGWGLSCLWLGTEGAQRGLWEELRGLKGLGLTWAPGKPRLSPAWLGRGRAER